MGSPQPAPAKCDKLHLEDFKEFRAKMLGFHKREAKIQNLVGKYKKELEIMKNIIAQQDEIIFYLKIPKITKRQVSNVAAEATQNPASVSFMNESPSK